MEIWVGMATLVLLPTNVKRSEGFVGAYAGFAVRSATLADAVAALSKEFEESGFVVMGIDAMMPVAMLDRPLTEHEQMLVEASETYPVQFKNVHLHKGDA